MNMATGDVVSKARAISRRDVLGLIGAGAGRYVQGIGGEARKREQSGAPFELKHGHASLAAKPSPIEIDLAATAVLVVDMQNDFASKGGMLDRLGADISPIQRSVMPTAAVLASARNAGISVIYLKMAFKPDLSDVGPPDSPNRLAHIHAGVGGTIHAPNGSEGRILIRDTWNTAVIEELRPASVDLQIYKHRYSGFFKTELDEHLKLHGIRYLIVTGCTTSVCVESTIRDAMFLDYSAILLADCTGEPLGNDFSRSNHQASLFLIAGRNFGWVSSSSEFITSMEQLNSSGKGAVGLTCPLFLTQP